MRNRKCVWCGCAFFCRKFWLHRCRGSGGVISDVAWMECKSEGGGKTAMRCNRNLVPFWDRVSFLWIFDLWLAPLALWGV